MQFPSESDPPTASRQESLPLRGGSQRRSERQATGGPSRSNGRANVENPGGEGDAVWQNSERIERAIQDGRDISGLLGDSMRHNFHADTEASNLRTIIQLADELRSYNCPVEFTIGLVGDSGVGKSSLINSLLDEASLAKSAGLAEACTSIVTEYHHARETDRANYTLEVDRMSDEEIEAMLREAVVDFRLYHLREPGTFTVSEEVDLLRKARLAWDTLTAAFGTRAECTELFFQDAQVSNDHLHQQLIRWKNELRWPPRFATQGTVIELDTAAACQASVEEYLKESLWPFIKVMRIYLRAPVLRGGIVLVDMPGFQDINRARVQAAENRLYQCDEVFIVTGIDRAATNASVENIMRRQLGSNLGALRRSQGVAIVCTKSEIYTRLELERDLSSEELDVSSLQALDSRIEAAEDDAPAARLRLLKAELAKGQSRLRQNANKLRRDRLFIQARNSHVSGRIQTHYANHNVDRRVEVFCVSNLLYRDSRELEVTARRRSSTSTDTAQVIRLMQETSGIPQLREFIQGIPQRAQVEETQHFLNTRLRTLVERTDLWLAGSMQSLSINQEATRTIETSQSRLREGLDVAVRLAHDSIEDSKFSLLQQPMVQGCNRWKEETKPIRFPWEAWAASSWSAFCRHEGEHQTGRHPWINWNAELLKPMAADIRPSEEAYRSAIMKIMEDFRETANNELVVLNSRIAELNHTERFTRTLPRRRRNLEYEVEEVQADFALRLESIYHDLLNTHSGSYIRCHMRPMYIENAHDRGSGVRQRCVQNFIKRIDRAPLLFVQIKNMFLAAVNELMGETIRRISDLVDRYCQDIRGDLELLRGEQVAAAQDTDGLRLMQEILEGARTRLDDIIREFEARG